MQVHRVQSRLEIVEIESREDHVNVQVLDEGGSAICVVALHIIFVLLHTSQTAGAGID